MSKLAEEVEGESEVGCCVTRMGICHCDNHVDLAGQIVARKLRQILTAAGAADRLVEYIQQLERAE